MRHRRGEFRFHYRQLSTKTLAIPRVSPEAEELYLKGRYYWTKRTPADLTKAVDFFTQSIVRDPNYAPAYVGLADCYNLLREFSAMPAAEAFPRASAAARKAVELDDSSAEAHASLAFVMFYWNWDITGAEREFRRAIKLNPDYALAHHWYATFLMVLGRSSEALQEINRAQKLDPASNPILADKGLILFHAGQTDQAIALLNQIETAQPAFFSTHKYLSYIYLVQRDYPNYLAQALQAALLSHDEQELAIVRAAEQGFKSGGERELLSDILREQKKFYDQRTVVCFSGCLHLCSSRAERRRTAISPSFLRTARSPLPDHSHRRSILQSVRRTLIPQACGASRTAPVAVRFCH